MKRKKSTLLIIACLIMSLVCFPTCTWAETGSSTDESYRVVKAYKLDGAVTVTRADGSQPSVYNGMNFKSGDKVEVGANSHLYLKVDNDKYVMADEKTTFVIDVSGTAKDSKTKITLLAGNIMHRVDEKLSSKSSYEISTSNATTAIRGTLVKTKAMTNPDQTQKTDTTVFEGIVTVKTNASGGKDGNAAAEQEYRIVAGQSLTVAEGSSGQMAATQTTVDYSKLNSEELQFLIDSTETGRELTISAKDMETLKVKADNKKKQENNSSSNPAPSPTEPVDKDDMAQDVEPESAGTKENLPE